jgi:predicted RND superfamily exporter protein
VEAGGEQPTRSSRILAVTIAALLRHRGLALVCVALALALALVGLTRLEINLSSTAFYGDASAGGERLAEFHERWGADDDTLLILVHPESEADTRGVLDPERLAAIAELGEALARVPTVAHTRTIADAPLPMAKLPFGAEQGEDTTLTQLLERFDLAAPGSAQRRALLERLPFVPSLLSAEGRDTVILVELTFSSDDVARTEAAVEDIEQVVHEHDELLARVGLTHELAGVPAIRAGFFELLVHDQILFVPLTLALIGLALLLVFRRVHGVLIPGLAAAVPTAMLVGIMGWAGEPIGLLNQAYFTLLPVIAVADAIHMLARFHEERHRGEGAEVGVDLEGLDARRRAIVRAGSHVGLACLLTTLTTAAGFASLGLAKMPILRSFGLYAALGVGLAFVVVIVLVPLLLSFVGVAQGEPEPAGASVLERGVDWVIRRPWWVTLVGVALCLAALVPASRVRIDNTLSGLIEDEHPASVASRRVDEHLGGVLGLEFEILAPAGIDLRTPEVLAALHGFERWLAEQPEVRSVEGLATTVAGAGELLGDATEVPASRVEIDARLDALAPYVPLERFVLGEGRRLRIRAGLPDDGGEQFVAFAERAEAELLARLAKTEVGERLEAYATGTALLAYRGVNGITHDLRNSFLLLFAVVVVLIGLLFRSLWPAVIAILPNFAPLLLGYALIGLLGMVLDPLAAVILTLALGIAVDDTVHVMVRTREELRGGGSVEEAVRGAVRCSGRAVAITSVVICGGLVLDLASSFPALRMLGLLGSVVIGLALVANLTLLPGLLVLLRGRGLEGRG